MNLGAIYPKPWRVVLDRQSGLRVVDAKERLVCIVPYVMHSPQNPPVDGDRTFNSMARALAEFIAACPWPKTPAAADAVQKWIRRTEN
jgi:hypothetical protein